MPRCDHETAREAEHARHDLLREVLLLRHARDQALHRCRKLRATYRPLVDRLRAELAGARSIATAAETGWKRAEADLVESRARECGRRCVFRKPACNPPRRVV